MTYYSLWGHHWSLSVGPTTNSLSCLTWHFLWPTIQLHLSAAVLRPTSDKTTRLFWLNIQTSCFLITQLLDDSSSKNQTNTVFVVRWWPHDRLSHRNTSRSLDMCQRQWTHTHTHSLCNHTCVVLPHTSTVPKAPQRCGRWRLIT